MVETWISKSCQGEICSMCDQPAAAKVGEEILDDDPNPYRHNLTAYVCPEHFAQIMGSMGKRLTTKELDMGNHEEILEKTINEIIDHMPLPVEQLFVGKDGSPEPLTIRFENMNELRNFFKASLTIGMSIAGSLKNI